ncbi:MAG: hypothetical protein AAGI06_19905 [Pseudomonadota bacterium]
MIRIATIAVIIVCAPAALAQSVTFSEGLWSYQATAQMGPAALSHSGEECFDATEGNYSLTEAVESISQDCVLVNSAEIEAGYSFQVACTGSIEGELSGKIVVGREAGRLNASGWTGSKDAPIDISVDATARRVAESCDG